MDQLVVTNSVKNNTRRWPLVLFYNMTDVAGIAAMIAAKSGLLALGYAYEPQQYIFAQQFHMSKES